VWGGANDVNKDNTKDAIKHFGNFVEETRNANIVITLPIDMTLYRPRVNNVV
jgi:hypothetical protein